MTVQHGDVALPPAAQLSVRTGLQALDTEGQVSLHVFSLAVLTAPVGAGHGELGAEDLVALQGVRGESSATIFTVDESLGAVVDLMGLQSVPGNLLAALVLTVERLEATETLVLLYLEPGEGLLAVETVDPPLLAGVPHVVLHVHPGDLGSALVDAAHGVLLAGVEVTLQPSQGSGPVAAFLSVDAEDAGLEDLGLRHRVTAQLQRGVAGAGLGVERVRVEVEDHLLDIGHLLVVRRRL